MDGSVAAAPMGALRTDFEADAALSRLARTPDRVPTGLLRKKVRILGKYCRPGKYAPVHGLGLFI
jgi:hypothetical protein